MTIMIETTTREEQDQDHQRGGGEIIRFPGSAVALAELADGAREYVAASLAPATRRAYRTGWRLLRVVHRT